MWAVGSLEEKVQRLMKTWEMELVHKADPNEFKTLDPTKFRLFVNGIHKTQLYCCLVACGWIFIFQ